MTDDSYAVRPFEPADTDAFLALYPQVFDGTPDEDWLAWKYTSNPYVDHAPIVVAERDGEIVGARPFFALPMRVSGDVVVALQPSDAMVHPDHRRRGLFTRMTEAALNRYGSGDAAFMFNFPNPNSLPGNLKLGWEVVGEVSTYYRIQDPGALAPAGVGPLGDLLTYGARGYLRTREYFAPALSDDVTVERHEAVPAETLAALHRRRRPSALHAARDEAFYRWRFGDSPTDYATYLAARDGDVRCGLVTARGRHAGEPTTRIVDVAPPDPEAGSALRTALGSVLRDAGRDAAVVAPAAPLPDDLMAALGFHERNRLLSRFTAPTVHVARSLDGDDPSQTVAGVDLLDERNWLLSFAEFDTR